MEVDIRKRLGTVYLKREGGIRLVGVRNLEIGRENSQGNSPHAILMWS